MDLRVRALEAVLAAKGCVEPAYLAWLRQDTSAAIAALGYTVAFEGRELWGNGVNARGLVVHIDAWEPCLCAAASEKELA